MIVRSVVGAAYAALAVVVGVAYGWHGLVVLLFFYVWAGLWVAFLLVWGWAARAAGRWNYERLDSAPPVRESSDFDSGHGEAEPVAHRQPAAEAQPIASSGARRRRPIPAL